MAYSYNPNVPQSNQTLAATQQPIQNNFNTLNEVFGINHVPFTSTNASLQGKHNFCSFPSQASDPSTTTTELALYAKTVAGVLGLYVREQNNGTAIPLFLNNSIAPILNSSAFYLTLGSGLSIQGGTISINSTLNTYPYISSGGQNFPNATIMVFLQPISTLESATVVTVTNTGFEAASNKVPSNNCYYLAIGY